MASSIRSLLAATALAVVAAGCGGSSQKLSPDGRQMTVGPHGGVAVPLADKGYAEVMIDRKATGKSKSSPSVVLRVYFYATDLRSPLPDPENVSLTVSTPENEAGSPVSLSAGFDSPTTARKCWSSEAGNWDYDELRGDVTATIGGEAITRKWQLRM